MNTKKTINVFRGLAIIGCFMIAQQAAAQNWPGSQTGPNEGRWILNKNKSNAWAHMRLQVSNDRAWNMINQGDLWWGYAANDTFTDTGTERMRLTTTGNLGIGTSTPSEKLEVAGVTSSQGIRIPGRYTLVNGHSPGAIEIEVASGNYNAIRGYSGTEGVGTIHFFDDTWQSGAPGSSAGGINISGTVATTIGPWSNPTAYFRASDGNVGIGTTSPQTKLDVNGTGYFSSDVNIGGNVGIGTTSPQTKLDVNGLLTVRHAGDNSTIEFLADNNKSASIGVQDDSDQGFYILTNGTYRVNVNQNGNVGIGTSIASEKLEVDGTVKATSFTSSANSFPDYVFADDYKVMPLAELEGYVKANKHLPNMPSEKEVVENGLNLPEVVTKSVENIETIYLHLIRMEKEIEALKQENAGLKQQLKQRR